MGSGEAGAGPSVRSQAGTPGVREGVEEGQGADPWTRSARSWAGAGIARADAL